MKEGTNVVFSWFMSGSKKTTTRRDDNNCESNSNETFFDQKYFFVIASKKMLSILSEEFDVNGQLCKKHLNVLKKKHFNHFQPFYETQRLELSWSL